MQGGSLFFRVLDTRAEGRILLGVDRRAFFEEGGGMRAAGFLFRAALAATCCLAMGRWAAALPPAVAYPGLNNALTEPNAAERELLDAIQRDRSSEGLAPLRWDGMISAVAREHSEDMAQYKYNDYVSPWLGTLEYRLHRAGISGANARFMVFHMPSLSALMDDLKTSPVPRGPVCDVGIGIVTKGIYPVRELYVTLIFVERHSTLEPFPTLPILGAEYRLAGRLEAGLKSPSLDITAPDGRVTERKLDLTANGGFSTTVRFDRGRGEYSVEITAVGKHGPTVLDLMHCYAGMEYPEPVVPPKPEAAPADLRDAEQAMAHRINQARADANLPPLTYDDRLADAARGHSEDMAKNGYFAHVSPTAGDLLARMNSAGIQARKFTENIANNQDLAAAHRELMESPGHRKNILDPEATSVGVGIARDEAGQFLVTEDFLQRYQDYDCAALAAQLIRDVNDARANAGFAALETSAALSRIALDNSRAMMRNGKLSPDRAKALLARERLPLRYVEMGLLSSTDPPKPEQVPESLKARYHDIGVGIVQSAAPSGEKMLWATVLLGVR
jgi:uncharacterized protein YkwD